MSRALLHVRLGLVPYGEALNLQQRLVKHLVSAPSEDPNVVLTLEHPPTYTAGQRLGDKDIGEERLRAVGADVFHTFRGGQMTFHGPGQLVMYPIINLNRFKPVGLRMYIEIIEEAAIRTCADVGLKAKRTKHAGVWLGNRKVCAVGVHAGRYVTMHGLALNCNTDLAWFRHIIPCGIEDETLGVTSLSQELNRNVTVAEMEPRIMGHLTEVLGATTTTFSSLSPDSQQRVAAVMAPFHVQ